LFYQVCLLATAVTIDAEIARVAKLRFWSIRETPGVLLRLAGLLLLGLRICQAHLRGLNGLLILSLLVHALIVSGVSLHGGAFALIDRFVCGLILLDLILNLHLRCGLTILDLLLHPSLDGINGFVEALLVGLSSAWGQLRKLL